MNHAATARNGITNYVCSLVDAGSAAGILIYQDVQGNQVAKLTFSKPAFGSANNGVATANAIIADNNAVGGTISQAAIKDSAGNTVFICTVTYQGGGGDIQLNSTTVAVGQQVVLNSLTYSAPP
jgi:hypothetical protein